MVSKVVKVVNAEGLHMRPAGVLAKEAAKYKSNISLVFNGKKINAKSIMGIMAFNPSNGMKVNIVANGEDEAEALDAMEKFLVCE